MMENSQNLFSQHTLEEDKEVDSIYSQNSEINVVKDEKPLSPVLSGTSIRKLIYGKKVNKRKICKTKLLRKFEKSQQCDDSSNKIPDFPEDSFSVSVTDVLLDRIEKLEQVEKFREDVYNTLMSNSRDYDDSNFKKPLLPPPVQSHKMKSPCKTTAFVQSNIKKDEPKLIKTESMSDTVFKRPINIIEIPKVQIPLDNKGFQTAGGKTFQVSDKQLYKHCKLFEDILTPNSTREGSTRSNKYNYIHKNVDTRDGYQEFKNKPNLETTEHTIDKESLKGSSRKCSTSNNALHTIESIFNGEDFSDLKLVDKKLAAGGPSRNVFCEESFDDLKLQSSFEGFKKATEVRSLSVNNKKSTETKCLVNSPQKTSNIVKDENFDNLKTDLSRKNIFGDENFNDLNFRNSFRGFKKVSEVEEFAKNSKTETEGLENMRNTSADQRFSNICKSLDGSKHISHQNSIPTNKTSAVSNINPQNQNSCTSGDFTKGPEVKAVIVENASAKTQERKALQAKPTNFGTDNVRIPANPLKRNYKDIFADEDLSDLLPPAPTNKTVGFRNSSSIHNFGPPEPKRSRTIFADNNLSDLKPMRSFKDHGVTGFSTIQKDPKNIFEGEDFSDLKALRTDFKNFKSHTVTGFTRVKKDPKTIFEGEDFSDLNCFNVGGFSKKVFPSKFENVLKEESKTVSENVKAENNLSFTQEISKSGISNTQMNLLVDNALNNSALVALENSLKEVNLLVELSHDIIENFKGFTDEDKTISSIISEFFATISSDLKRKLDVSIEKKETCNVFNIIDIHKTLKQIYNKKNSAITPNYKESKRQLTTVNEDLLPQSKKQKNSSQNTCDGITPNRLISCNSERSILKNRTRKRLGTSFSPTIQVSQAKLERARKLFEREMSPKSFSTSTPVRNNFESLSFNQNNVSPIVKTNNITPIRKANSFNSVSSSTAYNFNRNSVIEKTMINKPLESSKHNSIVNVEDKRFSLEASTKGDLKDWIRELEIQRHALEEKLRFINKKQSLLNKQICLLDENNEGHNKPNPGVLYSKKNEKLGKISLRNFVGSFQCPGDEICSRSQFLLSINPQNAEKVHFMIENKNQVSVITKDGAVVVPNSRGAVSIIEIENAFKVIPGVDPKLILKNWIRNHFKWIVWKLSSYERMFPKKFEGVFSLENVMQQLKYRYDREIDKVERSALRRIVEKDDVPQKRMVLCVSDILKIDDNRYEIELTDGWYSIRTVLDRPLGNQIVKGKIKVGFKLVTCGAELLNCDGCHPLEVTDMVRLKINFNSTRRARWDAKLGYQKDCRPFMLPIETFVEDGGIIGCVRFYVSRVYPVKYMEKIGGVKIWRNKKAEERRSQEWQLERLKVLEKIQENVQKSYNSLNDSKSSRNYSNISEIEDPQILYEIISTSRDPEAVEESLTESQKSTLFIYQFNKSLQEQYQMEKQMKQKVAELQYRDITALLKIKIIDVLEKNEKQYSFHIWRPTEAHLQLFREDNIFTAYNVSYSERWGLSANMKTQFKLENKSEDVRFVEFRRKVTFIENLKELNSVDEFDTIGLVIDVKLDDAIQQLWISDCQKNLLLINVYEVQNNIVLFDNLKPGHIVTGCNLTFNECNSEANIATGSHFTIFARYSKYKHLQEALDEFERTLPKDLDNFVKDCYKKVMDILSGHNSFIKTDRRATDSYI